MRFWHKSSEVTQVKGGETVAVGQLLYVFVNVDGVQLKNYVPSKIMSL